MEDYEKKYKEALERAKQFSENPLLEDSAGIVEYIFPELAESEDKQIMKEIAEFIYNSAFKQKDIKKKEKWLTWFEKQGRVKESTISQHENKTCKESNNSLTCENERISKEIRDFICWATDGGSISREQVEKSKSWLAWLTSPVLSNSSNNGKNAWNEEDEVRLEKTIFMLKEGASRYFMMDDITKATDWLKSLKDRV